MHSNFSLLTRCLKQDNVALYYFIFKMKNNRFSALEWQSIVTTLNLEVGKSNELCNKTALSMMAAVCFFSNQHKNKVQGRALLHRALALGDPFAYYVNALVLYYRKLYTEADAQADLAIKHQCLLGYHIKALVLMVDATYAQYLQAREYLVKANNEGNHTFCLYLAAKWSIEGWRYVSDQDASLLRLAKRHSEDDLEKEKIDKLIKRYRRWGVAHYHVAMALGDEKIKDFAEVLELAGWWKLEVLEIMLRDTKISAENKKQYVAQVYPMMSELMLELNKNIKQQAERVKDFSYKKNQEDFEKGRELLLEYENRSQLIGDHCYQYAKEIMCQKPKPSSEQRKIAYALRDACTQSVSPHAYEASVKLQNRLYKKIMRQAARYQCSEWAQLIPPYKTIHERFTTLTQKATEEVALMTNRYHDLCQLVKKLETFADSFCAEAWLRMPERSICNKQPELKVLRELMSQFEKHKLSPFQFALALHDVFKSSLDVEPSKYFTVDVLMWLRGESKKWKDVIVSIAPKQSISVDKLLSTDVLAASDKEVLQPELIHNSVSGNGFFSYRDKAQQKGNEPDGIEIIGKTP